MKKRQALEVKKSHIVISLGPTSLCIPFWKISGVGKAKLAIITGLHGDEDAGQKLVHDLVKKLEKCKNLNFSDLLIMPYLNPSGLINFSRLELITGVDLNRVATGGVGNLAESYTYSILKELRDRDQIIDVHSSWRGRSHHLIVPVMDEVEADFNIRQARLAATLGFSRNFLLDVGSDSKYKNTFLARLSLLGVNIVAVETDNLAFSEPQRYNFVLEALLRFCCGNRGRSGRTLGVSMVKFHREFNIFAQESGLFLPEDSLKIGDIIKAGMPLGRMYPFESLGIFHRVRVEGLNDQGELSMIRNPGVVRKGDRLAIIAVEVEFPGRLDDAGGN